MKPFILFSWGFHWCVLFVAGASLGLAGCQVRMESPDEGRIFQVAVSEGPDGLSKVFRVVCENPATCNESVGLLISREDKASIGVCTVSLVAADIVMTNRHCLPDHLTKAGSACAKDLVVKFPKTSRKEAEVAACGQVLEVSPYYARGEAKQQTDYAFLRLQKNVNRRPLPLDPSGVKDGERLTIVRMSPYAARMEGVISELECRAAQNTIVTPVYSSEKSPLVHLNDCPIVHGNSGSPALDASGKLKMIVQQGRGGKGTSPMAKLLKDRKFARGSNLSCIRFEPVGLSGSNASACQRDLSEKALLELSAQLFSDTLRKSRALEDIQLQIQKANSHQMFEWTIRLEELSSADYMRLVLASVRMTPKCFKRWDPKDPRVALDHHQVQFLSRSWEIRLALDDDLRPTTEMSERSDPWRLSFSPRKVATLGYADVDHGPLSPDKTKPEPIALLLSTCADQR